MCLLVQANVKDERMITSLLLAGSAVNHDREEITEVEIVRILVLANVFVSIIHPDTGTDNPRFTQRVNLTADSCMHTSCSV